MKNLSIKHVIACVVGALIVLTLIVGALGYHTTQRSVELLENMALRSTAQQTGVANLMLRSEMNRSHILQALQHNPDSKYSVLHQHELSVHSQFIANNSAELRKEQEALTASIVRPQVREAITAWIAASDNMAVGIINDAMRAIEAGNWDLANEMLGKKINPTYNKSMAAYKELQVTVNQLNAEQGEELHAELTMLNTIMVATIVVAVLLACGGAVYLTRAIGRPLEQAVGVARRVADGDLTARIEVDSRNEFGQLLSSLRDMTASLSNIVGDVRSGSDTIATASSQIAAGNLDLSGRTEQQASSIEETAASVEELTSTVRQNAENARQANGLAASASDVATRGGAVVAEVVGTMNEINESSRKIVDIIAVIDGIAFQTNILALNAAVEAARAGEQGRGFAVVASEVRNLAQRSAGAAKEIKELITDSVGKVESGSRLVDQAGATMDEIVTSVRRVADIMGEITAASSEQSAGIEQIHHAISQMDQVTQQNAALVEEAASAAQSLQDSAAGLAERVSVFKVAAQPSQPARLQQPQAQRPALRATAPRAAASASAKPARAALAAAPVRETEWETF
ncbi:methyl-accepting chemotaxis protein [Massilia sp.]|uniref:methyl-accepting chemotaxis protein n=1 Tax=Massilia sp. TaxID=1882437 RepID=UPI0028A047F2|nr:methyl-accepting chemotaxis protein [Massilia sp.]